MRVALKSCFDRYTGYGNDGVDIALSLDRNGVDVVPFPKAMLPGLPPKFTRLLQKDPVGPYDVVMMFDPPFDMQPVDWAWHAEKAVGWSMWEKSPLIRLDMKGHGWKEPGWKKREHWWSRDPVKDADDPNRPKDWLDLMLVTCPMNVEAFAALDPHVRYEVMPCGIEPDHWPLFDRRDNEGPLRFGMIGMLAGRKDPFLMLQAWREVYEEVEGFDAILELKTASVGLHPALVNAYPNVILHDRAWPRDQVRDWYQTIDVLVSVSRGEGNNKPAMEFMSSGGVVMASNWSGHQNWLHKDWGIPLPGALVTNSDGVSDFRVDKDMLKKEIERVWRMSRGDLHRMGGIGATFVRDTLSWDAVAGRTIKLLENL